MADPVPAQKPLVLAVEDDQEVLTLLARMLSSIADVEIARDGVEALEVLQSGVMPDLIITDLMMPRMDGLTLAKQLKADERTKRIPLIVLTAKNTPRDVVAGINAGARNYITKPFKHEELLDKVRSALRI